MSSSTDRDLLDKLGEIPDPIAGAAPPSPAPAKPPPERALTREERRRRNVALAGLSIVYLALLLWRVGLRPDLSTVLLQLLIWAVVVVCGIAAVVSPAKRGLPTGLRVVQLALLVVAAVFAIVAVLSTRFDLPLDWRSTATCVTVASVMALGPLLLAGVALRHSFLSAAAWRGAAVGAACGLGGSIGVHAHCPIQATMHVLLAHGFPILLGAALGALLGASKGRA